MSWPATGGSFTPVTVMVTVAWFESETPSDALYVKVSVSVWPPRSYVAITRTSPGVSLGCDRAREEASFHVVYGTW